MQHERMKRGQGTTEYLIILAIVIVIALVVVGVLGNVPSVGTGVSQGQSKAYWGGTQPLAVIDWQLLASGTSSIVVQNMSSATITMVRIVVQGVPFANTSVLAPGGKATITGAFNCPTAGQPYSRTLSFRYSTDNISNIDFNGTLPLSGTCG